MSCYDYLSGVYNEKTDSTKEVGPLKKFSVFDKNSQIKKGLTYTTFVKDVYDGDTFTDKNNRRFRLFGIDTPEIQLNRPNRNIDTKLMKFHALRSKKVLQDLVLNRWISFEIVDVDNYHRLVVIIKDENGENINLKMVEGGFAISRYSQYENPKKKYYHPEHRDLIDKLRKAQEKAKNDNLSVWKDDVLKIYGIKVDVK